MMLVCCHRETPHVLIPYDRLFNRIRGKINKHTEKKEVMERDLIKLRYCHGYSIFSCLFVSSRQNLDAY